MVAMTATPKYEAEIVVMPVSTDGNEMGGGGALSSIAAQFGGLAALAGIGSAGSSRFESLETLESRALAQRFIELNTLMPVLFERRWDAVNHRWKPDWRGNTPTLWDGEMLMQKILQVREDRRTGIVRLTFTWSDRDHAAAWANGIVATANDFLRQGALHRANDNLAFLNNQVEQTTSIEVRQAIFGLIEAEMKKLMLAKTTPEYAFRVIDPAVIPKERQWPRPLLLVAFGIFAGALLWLMIAAGLRAISDQLDIAEKSK
jgi:uncharacterized protein involved in exopolysaccharide biosynthesis